MADASSKKVRVEMDEATIARLLAGGQVCAADFSCPDLSAKRVLWRLVLESCRFARRDKPCVNRPCRPPAGSLNHGRFFPLK